MPTYYFHVCDGLGFCEDEEGRDLPDADAAHREAVRGMRDIIAGDVGQGEINLAAFIEVEDENRRLLFTLLVEDAVKIKSERPTSPRR